MCVTKQCCLHCRDSWTYVLLVANLANAYKLVPHGWSISVQAQWYLVFPIVLCFLGPHQPGFRRRVGLACIGCFTASTAYQAWVVHAFSILLPVPWAGFNFGLSSGHKARDVQMAWDYFSWVYGSFVARLADFAAGALVYLIAATPSAAHRVRSKPHTCTFAAALALVGALTICFGGGVAAYPAADPTIPPSVRFSVLIGVMAVWIPVSTAWLMLYVMLQPDAMSKLAAQFLSWDAWNSLAERSYSAYCLHWEVLFWIFWLLPVTDIIGPLNNSITYLLVWAMTISCTLALAGLQDHLLTLVYSALGHCWRRQALAKEH